MKTVVSWVVVFVVLLALAYPVYLGTLAHLHEGEAAPAFLGIPSFFWWALNLTVFLYLLARYVGRPIGEFLESRKDTIAAELRQAREKLAEAEAMKAEVLSRLDKIEGEVAAIRNRAEEQGRNEADRIAEQAKVEEERFLRRVGDEISRRQEETRQVLIQETQQLTAKMAEDLLKKHMTEADRKRVLGESIEALRAVEGRT